MYDGPHRFLDMSWSYLSGKTDYPFFLLLAQHHTERILVSKLTSLGVSIKWEHKAVSIAAGDGGVTVGFENGSMITARYVVGADGSRSSVRNHRLHLVITLNVVVDSNAGGIILHQSNHRDPVSCRGPARP